MICRKYQHALSRAIMSASNTLESVEHHQFSYIFEFGSVFVRSIVWVTVRSLIIALFRTSTNIYSIATFNSESGTAQRYVKVYKFHNGIVLERLDSCTRVHTLTGTSPTPPLFYFHGSSHSDTGIHTPGLNLNTV